MTCYRCGAESAVGKKFCGDCGASFNRDEYVESVVQKQVEAILAQKFKDQKFVTSEVAEGVANKILGWGKLYLSIAAPIIAICGIALGIWGYTSLDSVRKAADAAVSEIQIRSKSEQASLTKSTDEARQNLDAASTRVKAIQTEISSLHGVDDQISHLKETAKQDRYKLLYVEGITTQLDERSAKNSRDIRDVDSRAQAGIEKAQSDVDSLASTVNSLNAEIQKRGKK